MAARKISNVTAQEKSAAEGVMTDVFSRFAAGDKIDEDGLKRFVSEAGLLDADMGLDLLDNKCD